MNGKSLANLVLYKPGQSGNPAGMKPGAKQGLRAHFNRTLNKKLPQNVIALLKLNGMELEDNTFGEVISYVVAVKACAGDLTAARLMADFTEPGLPKAAGTVNQYNGPVLNKYTIELVDADNRKDISDT